MATTQRSEDAAERFKFVPRLVGIMDCPPALTVIGFGRDLRMLDQPFHLYAPLSAHKPGRTGRGRTGLLPVNRALQVLTSGSSPRPRQWRGPVVMMRCADRSQTTFVDMEPADVHDMRAFFALLSPT